MIKVMVFGVFDLLHPGHINFLKQAKKLGDFLIVSVARDRNVKKIKGNSPSISEKDRAKALRKLAFVDKVVLGGVINPWPHIRREKPGVIALGYDQKPYVTMTELKKTAKIVRLKPHKPKVYKSSRLRPA
jgi:FAD synthetase